MEKTKLTIQEQLSKRKFKRPNRFYNWFYHMVMVDFGLKKHNAEITYIDDIRKEKGPCFILWNHLSRLDHSFILKATYPQRFSMIAEYNEFFRSHLSKVFEMQQILPKKNFCVDMAGIKAILSIIKQGGIPAMAPEGLATTTAYNERIIPGVGRLLKHCSIPVYMFDFAGQGLAAPTFSPIYRLGGKNTVTVRKMFTVEQLKELTDEQVEDIIQEAFNHDDYAWQKENRFEWDTQGRGCECMEDVLYRCPCCENEGSMKGIGDSLDCSSCGLHVDMDKYLEFHPSKKHDNFPINLSEWALWQRRKIIEEIRNKDDYEISVKVKIGNIPTDHLVKSKERSTEIVGEGILTLNRDGLHYEGTRNNEPYSFDLSYKQYYRLIVNINMKCFALYINNEYFEFFPEENIVGKLDFVVQEMNRLHFDTWKPLKEHLYLYEGFEK